MKNKFIKTTLSISILSLFVSVPVFAKEHTHIVDKTIKGFYPSFDSIGSKVINGNPNELKVGDIIAIPSDALQSNFFELVDRDGDPLIKVTDNKSYEVVWWKVTPKAGFKWSDDQDATGTNVSSWNDVDAEAINESNYISIPDVATSKALRIPPVKENQRIAFSITPETAYGDPVKGKALYAPDLTFFWGNTETDQKPGLPPEGSIDPNNPNPPVDVTKPGGNNPEGGGEISGGEVGEAVVHIYIDKNNNGVLDFGVDELLLDYPTVDTTYIADIQIITEIDGERTFRELNDSEKESIRWHITNNDNTVTYAFNDGSNRVSESYAFTTQTKNTDADPLIQTLPVHFSEQGTTISVSFSFNE